MSRILLINDEDDLLYMYRVNLEDAGHIVETTTDGDDAIARAKRFHPDVIGLDWIIPRTPGEEILRRLRADPQTQSIPVLVISALRGLADRVGRALVLRPGFSDRLKYEIPRMPARDPRWLPAVTHVPPRPQRTTQEQQICVSIDEVNELWACELPAALIWHH